MNDCIFFEVGIRNILLAFNSLVLSQTVELKILVSTEKKNTDAILYCLLYAISIVKTKSFEFIESVRKNLLTSYLMTKQHHIDLLKTTALEKVWKMTESIFTRHKNYGIYSSDNDGRWRDSAPIKFLSRRDSDWCRLFNILKSEMFWVLYYEYYFLMNNFDDLYFI